MEENNANPVPAMPPPEAAPESGGAFDSGHQSFWSALSWARDLVFSILIAVVLILFIYQPVKVEGHSMEPGLENDERIFINKFSFTFGLGDIHRGDTVVFWYPPEAASREKSYIKRVIGLPGDRVRIEHGQVFVNDMPLVENYVSEANRDFISWHSVEDKVPADKYFVLGDHRNQSSDSRTWGYVPKEDIYGKAVFVYWPLEQLGRVE